jgi:flavin-dependent dehydrogenase
MDKKYDVIVIGGQFAGLSFAKEASKMGLNVLVLEKKPNLTKGFGTTGIIVNQWLKYIDIDKKLLYGPVGDIDCYFTKNVFIRVDTDIDRFYMSRTDKILLNLKNDCIKNGVDIRENHKFEKIVKISKNIVIEAKNKNGLKQFTGKFIIGADGPKSLVAKEFGLSQNKRFLSGLEYVMQNQKGAENNKYSLLYDYDIAPGYCAWLIINNEQYVLGIAGYMGKFEPLENLLKARAFFEKKEKIKLNIENGKAKAGLIPVGGLLPNRVNKHCMLIGDAGGYCGPLCAGGILPAMLSGRFSAPIIFDYLKNGELNENFIIKMVNDSNIVSDRRELFLRKLFDRINDNKEMELLGKFFSKEEANHVMTKLLLDYPENISARTVLKRLAKAWTLYDDMARIGLCLLD